MFPLQSGGNQSLASEYLPKASEPELSLLSIPGQWT